MLDKESLFARYVIIFHSVCYMSSTHCRFMTENENSHCVISSDFVPFNLFTTCSYSRCSKVH